MRKQLKKLLLSILVIVMFSCLFAGASQVSSQAADGGTTVYKTATGKCYHTGTCKHISKSGTPITLEKAIDLGLKPCSVCNPPTLTDTKDSNSKALTKSAADSVGATATSFEYVLNTNSKKFHYSTCASAKKISDKNRATSSLSRDELIAGGYSPCGNCNP